MRKALLFTFLLTGCADLESDEDIGVIEQEVGWWGYSWGCGAVVPCSLDLGPDNDRTCFLSGVRGDLGHEGSVRVQRSGGRWVLNVIPWFGQLAGDAVCVNSVTNRTAEYVQHGDGTTLIGPGTSQRRCFLTGVENAPDGQGFNDSSNWARVQLGGWGIWYMSGDQDDGYNNVYAMCVDVPTNQGSWLWVAPDPGWRLDNLASNLSGGVACAMTGLGGRFDGGYSDGVQIQYDVAGSQWKQKTVNGKRAWSNCVK